MVWVIELFERLERREEERRARAEADLATLMFSALQADFVYTPRLLEDFFAVFGSIARLSYDEAQRAGVVVYNAIKAAETAAEYLSTMRGYLAAELLVADERDARKTALKSSTQVRNDLTSEKLFAYAVRTNTLNDK